MYIKWFDWIFSDINEIMINNKDGGWFLWCLNLRLLENYRMVLIVGWGF